MNEFLFPEPVKPPENIYLGMGPDCKNTEMLIAPFKIICSKCGKNFYLHMLPDKIHVGFSFEEIQKTAESWNHFADIRKKDDQ